MSASPRGNSTNGDRGRGRAPAGEVSRWEWVAGAIGLALVLAAVGYMVRAAMQPATPPRVAVTSDSVTAGHGGYLVHFTARNEGRTTAAGVTIEGELREATGTATRSSTTLDFVPAASSRSGGLYFQRDPRGAALVLRASGYADP